MAIDLKLSGVDRPNWDPIPEDDYTLVVEDLSPKPQNKNSVKPGEEPKTIIHCVFKVADGEYEGRKILHWQGIDGEQRSYAKQMFESIIGRPLEDDMTIEDESELFGTEFNAHIGTRPDNRDANKMQNYISYFILPFDPETV